MIALCPECSADIFLFRRGDLLCAEDREGLSKDIEKKRNKIHGCVRIQNLKRKVLQKTGEFSDVYGVVLTNWLPVCCW